MAKGEDRKMRQEMYEVMKAAPDYSRFEFVSIGTKGMIRKAIVFTPIEIPGIVNLAFGDLDEQGRINDYSVSDNGDRNKILSTIASVIELYLNKYPDRRIVFKGSTPQRTRLYRMAISINQAELSGKFDIYAQVQNKFVPFEKSLPIEAILVRKKINNLQYGKENNKT